MNINDALAKEYNRGLADGKASVEQKHGHWIEEEFKTLDNINVFTVYRCSECGESTDAEDLPYCYRCGSKMDEVTE